MKITSHENLNLYLTPKIQTANIGRQLSRNAILKYDNSVLETAWQKLQELGVQKFWVDEKPELLKNFALYSKTANNLIDDLYEKKFIKEDIRNIIESLFQSNINNDIPDIITQIYYMLNQEIPSGCIEAIIRTANIDSSDRYKIINEILDIRESIIQNKHLLKQHHKDIPNSEIDTTLLQLPETILNTVNLIGKPALIHSMSDKLDNLKEYITILGMNFIPKDVKEPLIERINPTKSIKYNDLEETIHEYKNLYKNSVNEENKKEYQNIINENTKEKNNLIKNSIKDPKNIMELALITAALSKFPEDALDIIHCAPINRFENQDSYKKLLNKALYKAYEMPAPSERVLKILNFDEIKYLQALFHASKEFKQGFRDLVDLLEKNPDKSVPEIFDELKQNKITKEIFREEGLNYEAWVENNPESFIPIFDEEQNSTGMIVRKVNMYDIPHVLTLGNDASCCTKIGRRFDYSAPAYCKNKIISAIEVVDGKTCIGNTMCYIALANEFPALILDNIELKPQYRNNDNIRTAIFKYAKKLVKDIGAPSLPIYLTGRHHKINLYDLKVGIINLEFLGTSEDDEIYFDAEVDAIPINDTTRRCGQVYVYEPISSATSSVPKPKIEVSVSNALYLNPQPLNTITERTSNIQTNET